MSQPLETYLNHHWNTIITSDKKSVLKNEHFIILDDFLPPSALDSCNNYQNILNLSEKNQLIKEESYMEDEDSGQVLKIGEHPFYTLKMNKEEHSKSSMEEHCQLYSFTTLVGQYFQRIIYNDIVKKPNEQVDVDFFNKIALCKDLQNGLPLHLDNHNADTRKLTIVYYTTPYVNNQEEKQEMELKYPGVQFEERNWQGGLLRVYRPSTKLYNNYWEIEKVDIEPKFNRAVVFFSDTVVHKVTDTMPINDSQDQNTSSSLSSDNNSNIEETTTVETVMKPPRTTITTWVHCNDMSSICTDKVLLQRQMIKFFSDN